MQEKLPAAGLAAALIERRSYQLLQCVFKALHFDY